MLCSVGVSPTKEARGLGISPKQSVAWTVVSKRGTDSPVRATLHGLEARATQGRRRLADATKTCSHS
ncbi:MAG: hypothetical protein NZ556_01325 [Fimbriimonadales bacterium]|nr:hypothetical protein [Fimbriimonadales bacterium]